MLGVYVPTILISMYVRVPFLDKVDMFVAALSSSVLLLAIRNQISAGAQHSYLIPFSNKEDNKQHVL